MCWNKHGEEGLNELEAGCLNEGEVQHHATDHDEDLDDSGLFEGHEPLFPPNMLRPEDITDEEVRGFDDGEVLQRVHNVDQMLWDVEFQQVYTPYELATLKQFIENSKKPLYPYCQKYSRLSRDIKLLQLKEDHCWSNKSFKHLMYVLRDMLPEGNQIAESAYEVKKIICPLGIEVEKIHACKNSCVLFRRDYADLDKCPKCGYDRYKRKKDGGDDNNADDENEPGKIRGKKKKANRGAPMRVACYFCIIPRLRRWFTTRKEAQLFVGMTKAERSLIIRKMASLGTPQMQRNGVTLITTSHGLTT
jgi:hypothetical protein